MTEKWKYGNDGNDGNAALTDDGNDGNTALMDIVS